LRERIHTHLREHPRVAEGHKPLPSAAITGSQNVKTSEVSVERGYDAGKKINGRKGDILLDTIGLILLVMLLPASIHDRDGAQQLPTAFYGRVTRSRVKHIWSDGGYAGALPEKARKLWRCTIDTFKVLPRR
jgi:hypothetical protein